VAAIKQHRCPAIRGGELQTARRCAIGTFYLRDHAGERSVAQPILGHGQDLGVLGPLSVDDPVGRQTHLLQTRRIKIEPRERPKDRCIAKCRKPGGQACREQSRGGIVAERGRSGGNLVETVAIESSVHQQSIERSHSESKGWPSRVVVSRKRLAQRREFVGTRLCGGR